MSSRAEELFLEITSSDSPVDRIKQMVEDKREENDFLEFKGAGRIQDKDARNYWSKLLSAFANTEGGLVIWGIDAREVLREDGVKRDCAFGCDYVPNPGEFSEKLKAWRNEATLDPVGNVEIVEYDAENEDGAGFIVCFVPEGRHKPYRAAMGKDERYYQRINDSIRIIPHGILRSLFYPRRSIMAKAWLGIWRNNDELLLTIEIENAGHVTIRDAALTIFPNIPLIFNGAPWMEATFNNQFSQKAQQIPIKRKLNPDEFARLGAMKLGPEAVGGYDLLYSLTCLDQEVQHFLFEVPSLRSSRSFARQFKIGGGYVRLEGNRIDETDADSRMQNHDIADRTGKDMFSGISG